MTEKARRPKWLRKAAVAGDSSKVRELLAARAPIETVDENQMTALMQVEQMIQYPINEEQISQKADFEAIVSLFKAA